MSDLNSVSVTTATTLTGVTLPSEVLEHLYQSYSLKQKRAGLNCFLAASILFDLWAILIPQGQSWESISKFHRFIKYSKLWFYKIHRLVTLMSNPKNESKAIKMFLVYKTKFPV